MPDLDTLRQLTNDVGAGTALKLLGIFKVDADKRLCIIGDYLQAGGDVDNLRIQAHSLKGLCQTYGAMDGGEAAKLLQEACERGDQAEIQTKAQAAFDIISQDITATLEAAQTLGD